MKTCFQNLQMEPAALFFITIMTWIEGLRRVASPPEFVYQLGFYPKDLQEDGKYHHLKRETLQASTSSRSARVKDTSRRISHG